MTTPSFWATCTDETFSHIFRSATDEPISLLSERIQLLRTASAVWADPATSPLQVILDANHSAARLVNLLTTDLPSCFADTTLFHGKPIHLHKRAQILVADLWACFNGTAYGEFDDIDSALTMFADYRVPQMLQRLGVLWYSPRLEGRVRRGEILESGETLELEVRACSVWAVELLRREMARKGWDSWEVEVDDGDETEVGEQTAETALLEQPAAVVDDEDPREDSTSTHPGHPETNAETLVDNGDASAAEQNPTPPSAETPAESTSSGPPPAVAAPTAAPTPNQAPPPSKKSPPRITVRLNAVLLDYLLYDTAKEQEAALLAAAAATTTADAAAADNATSNIDGPRVLPHHRTRSIWY